MIKRILIISAILMSLSQVAYADDFWVFVRLEDRSGVTRDDDVGRSKRGDIVEITSAIFGEMPTAKEQAEWAIYMVTGITQADVDLLMEEYIEPNVLDEYGVPRSKQKAFRKHKYEGIKTSTVPGFYSTPIPVTNIKLKLRTKTALDLAMYEAKRIIYAYVQRPLIRLANVVTPRAFAAVNVSKLCAVGPNCTDEDYNTLQLWEDAKDGDLVTAAIQETAELYDDDGDFTGGVVINGSTTNTSYYMKITVPPAERHSGITNTGPVIRPTSGSDTIIKIQDYNTRVEWIEVDGSNRSYWNDHYGIGTDIYDSHYTGIRVENCIVHDMPDKGLYFTGWTNVRNVISYNNGDDGFYAGYSNDRTTYYNCTAYGNGDDGFSNMSSYYYCYNCVSMNNGGPDYGQEGPYAPKVYYSMSEDGTADDWGDTINSLINKVVANQFSSTADNDYHLKEGSDAIDAGNDYATTGNIDIDGRDRNAQGDIWDMGADEFAGNTCVDRPWACTAQERRLIYIN